MWMISIPTAQTTVPLPASCGTNNKPALPISCMCERKAAMEKKSGRGLNDDIRADVAKQALVVSLIIRGISCEETSVLDLVVVRFSCCFMFSSSKNQPAAVK